jgi:mono/diheme cytochrome c family protein/regulation of enolase protein 1 (concanavalin A-like superfamily)
VFVKHFEIVTNENDPSLRRRLETRLLVRDTNNGVYGVTYKWRSNNSDADLLPGGLTEPIVITGPMGTRTQTWVYPSQQECLQCHTPAANHVLGVKTRQLNGDLNYPATGVTDNQLRALNNVNLFNPALVETSISNYARVVAVTNTAATLETRVRSYLDANCAQCHRPGGVQGNWDARFDTPLANQNIINGSLNNDFGIPNARVVTPGSLERSLLYVRINTNQSIKMPPLARNVVDTSAAATIADWITSLGIGSGLPYPWEHQDIGSVAVEGGASYVASGGTFNVSGSGGDIWGTADGFHFAYVPAAGNCEVLARVTSVGNTSPAAKAGVMIRESLAPGARHVMSSLTYQSGANLQWRSSTDGGCSFTPGPGVTAPTWLRLTRTGSVFQAYQSVDGSAWTQFASTSVAMNSNVVVGLAVTAVTNGALNASTFDSVLIQPIGIPIVDTDGDGMPDDWEYANALDETNPADGSEDADNDGMTNLQEYRAGTNPRDALSLLRITSLVRTNNTVIVRFIAGSGRNYAVERSIVLPATNWLPVTNVPSGTNTAIAVTNAAGTNAQNYFRVRATP